MKLIQDDKVILFDDLVVDIETSKYRKIYEESDLKSNLGYDPDAMINFMKNSRVVEINNIPQLFMEEYKDSARDLNIKLREYFIKTQRNSEFDRNTNSLLFRPDNTENNKKKNLFGFIKKTAKDIIAKSVGLDKTLEFFNNIKLELGKEQIYISRIYDLLRNLSNAEKMNQEALKEKIISNLLVDKYESILFASDFKKVITEKQLLKLGKGLKGRMLEITYVKNYVRQIPDSIVELKLKADSLEIFDNYVVLHYGDKISEEMTEKEKRIAKDPILFGVIRGTRKLYYIGDWIDEDDDLTFKDIEEKLTDENFDIPEKIKINM